MDVGGTWFIGCNGASGHTQALVPVSRFFEATYSLYGADLPFPARRVPRKNNSCADLPVPNRKKILSARWTPIDTSGALAYLTVEA